MSIATLKRIESGQKASNTTLKKLAKFFQVKTDDLLLPVAPHAEVNFPKWQSTTIHWKPSLTQKSDESLQPLSHACLTLYLLLQESEEHPSMKEMFTHHSPSN
ncbi:helix-turn-helix domain-containing protein [Photobacterium sp. CCB-ST2H9]|uniref:helix-turn-helix domain-containing protein n=1 Tax=Photobacterium sp. CCB-ST2H9 TaxID=2912855 RepID=UPI003531A6F4